MAQGAARGIDERPFTLGGIEFVPSWLRPSRRGSLTLLKAERMVEPYRELLRPFPSANLVELGISQGGSVALLAKLAEPHRMLAVDISDEPVQALLDTLADHGLDRTVSARFGVDQADKETLSAIVDEEFGGEPLDVVIDDASHLYGPTVASFEVLFPRLRPGGLYVIEDWTWQDLFLNNVMDAFERGEARPSEAMQRNIDGAIAGEREPEVPCSFIGIEALMVRARSGDVISAVTVDEDWIRITRGPAPLDPATFTLRGAYRDRFRVLGHTVPPAGQPAAH